MISVVIPLYNKQDAIKKTLASVLTQTYNDWECIVVNDGSTDDSFFVVQEIIKDYKTKNIRLINQENGGVSKARNTGVKEANGDYIAFLDADDFWEPTYLEELNQLICDYPNAGIYGIGYSKIIDGVKLPSSTKLPVGFRGIVQNVWEINLMLYWTSSIAAATSILLFVPFNEKLTHGEDLDVWLQLMHKGDAVFYNKTLAYYVQDAENRAMNKVPPIQKHIVSVIPKYKQYREANVSFRKSFDTQMVYFLYEYMFTPYKIEAQELARLLDYSQLKFSLKFRMYYPCVYKILMNVKSFIK